MSAEERAAELVAVACRDTPANLCVELRGPGLDPVRVFHSPNPALVREMAEAVRAFVAAVLREAAGPVVVPVGDAGDRGEHRDAPVPGLPSRT